MDPLGLHSADAGIDAMPLRARVVVRQVRNMLVDSILVGGTSYVRWCGGARPALYLNDTPKRGTGIRTPVSQVPGEGRLPAWFHLHAYTSEHPLFGVSPRSRGGGVGPAGRPCLGPVDHYQFRVLTVALSATPQGLGKW